VADTIEVRGVTVDRIRRRMNRVPAALCEHCQRVEQIARELSERHGLDADAVGLAALAHDAAKHFSSLELLLRVEEYELPHTDFDLRNAPILHGPIGAEMLRREDRLDVPALYDAICWHTTGNPSGGDAIGHVVFLADKLDPIKVGRYPWQGELRELAEEDLNAAMTMFLSRNVIRMVENGKAVHPAAIEARNALLAQGVV
jgi:predicted HD superfamily hydrolase involved in NAD metabolism